MLFKQTSKAKEEKLVINVVEGSLPIVENRLDDNLRKEKAGRKKEQTNKETWNVQETERPGANWGFEKRWLGQATVRDWEGGPSGVLF